MKARRPRALELILLLGIGLALGARIGQAAFRSGDTAPELSKFLTLANGLRVFLLERHTIPLVNIAAAANCGTKDETPRTSGLAHLLEHCALFRGTTTRSGAEISREVRAHGAYYNARTGPDLTLFEMSLPSSQAEFGLSNLEDILFQTRFAQPEVEAERAVVLKEVNMVADDPIRRATGLVYEKLFASHPYALPLQGRPESLEALTARDLADFHAAYFLPANISLAVVGDFRLPDMEQLVQRVFGAVPSSDFKPPHYPLARQPADDLEFTLEMDVSKAYCLIGILGPDYNNPDQYAVDALCQVLGRGINPMMNAALRGSRELVETVTMSYSAMAYGGLILVTMTLNPKNITRSRIEALDFLRGTRSLNFGPEDIAGEEQFYALDHLGSAKNQIRFDLFRGQEQGLTVASSLARYLLLQDKRSERNYLQSIEHLTTSDLRRAAGRYLGGGKKIVVSVLPLGKGRRP
jgi:zinc protease